MRRFFPPHGKTREEGEKEEVTNSFLAVSPKDNLLLSSLSSPFFPPFLLLAATITMTSWEGRVQSKKREMSSTNDFP